MIPPPDRFLLDSPESPLIRFGRPDQLFRGDRYPTPFEFNEDVAQVFDDMVTRSVPLYQQVTVLAGLWAQRYFQPGTALYDLGCSTGTVLEFCARLIPAGAKLIGVDHSTAMIDQAQQKLKRAATDHQLILQCKDLQEIEWQSCSVVIANYTLQFLPPSQRQELIAEVFQALRPGGLFFFSEKVKSTSTTFQSTLVELYEGFKEAQGYSKSEIARKKQALENVLIPMSEAEYRDVLTASGFEEVESICKWNHFVTLVARKSW